MYVIALVLSLLSQNHLRDGYFHLKIIKLGVRKIRNVMRSLLVAGLKLKTSLMTQNPEVFPLN